MGIRRNWRPKRLNTPLQRERERADRGMQVQTPNQGNVTLTNGNGDGQESLRESK